MAIQFSGNTDSEKRDFILTHIQALCVEYQVNIPDKLTISSYAFLAVDWEKNLQGVTLDHGGQRRTFIYYNAITTLEVNDHTFKMEVQ